MFDRSYSSHKVIFFPLTHKMDTEGKWSFPWGRKKILKPYKDLIKAKLHKKSDARLFETRSGEEVKLKSDVLPELQMNTSKKRR
jgi:hypothetical protein